MAKLFTKEQVKYTDTHGDSDEYCRICGHAENKATFCRVLVKGGPINPDGWCSKWFSKPAGFMLKPFMVRGEAA